MPGPIIPGPRDVSFAAISDKGVRQVNADAVFADHDLFLVADGVGTGKNSDLASKMAISSIEAACQSGENLAGAVRQAHLSIRAFNQQNRTEQPVGTTIVAAQLLGRKCCIAWVGDSRAYVVDLSQHKIERLTQDHSLVNKLVQRGDITAEQARRHPKRNVITRCLGLTQQDELEVDTHSRLFGEQQMLLLCSDGLSGVLSENVILECLQQPKSLQSLAEELLRMALKAGSKDNVSLVLVLKQA